MNSFTNQKLNIIEDDFGKITEDTVETEPEDVTVKTKILAENGPVHEELITEKNAGVLEQLLQALPPSDDEAESSESFSENQPLDGDKHSEEDADDEATPRDQISLKSVPDLSLEGAHSTSEEQDKEEYVAAKLAGETDPEEIEVSREEPAAEEDEGAEEITTFPSKDDKNLNKTSAIVPAVTEQGEDSKGIETIPTKREDSSSCSSSLSSESGDESINTDVSAPASDSANKKFGSIASLSKSNQVIDDAVTMETAGEEGQKNESVETQQLTDVGSSIDFSKHEKDADVISTSSDSDNDSVKIPQPSPDTKRTTNDILTSSSMVAMETGLIVEADKKNGEAASQQQLPIEDVSNALSGIANNFERVSETANVREDDIDTLLGILENRAASSKVYDHADDMKSLKNSLGNVSENLQVFHHNNQDSPEPSLESLGHHNDEKSLTAALDRVSVSSSSDEEDRPTSRSSRKDFEATTEAVEDLMTTSQRDVDFLNETTDSRQTGLVEIEPVPDEKLSEVTKVSSIESTMAEAASVLQLIDDSLMKSDNISTTLDTSKRDPDSESAAE